MRAASAALAALALLTTAPLAGSVLAQGYPDQGAMREPGGDNPPHRPEAGTPRPGFYDFSGRADRVEQRISGAQITPRRKSALMGQLRRVRAEADFRARRHEGDLRDWDRELLQKRLDDIARALPPRGDG